jgi:hypothetical protein
MPAESAFSLATDNCPTPVSSRFSLSPAWRLSVDYQFINNPAYNTQRGPVDVFGLRLHAQLF